jgi:hypothetical protein
MSQVSEKGMAMWVTMQVRTLMKIVVATAVATFIATLLLLSNSADAGDSQPSTGPSAPEMSPSGSVAA